MDDQGLISSGDRDLSLCCHIHPGSGFFQCLPVGVTELFWSSVFSHYFPWMASAYLFIYCLHIISLYSLFDHRTETFCLPLFLFYLQIDSASPIIHISWWTCSYLLMLCMCAVIQRKLYLLYNLALFLSIDYIFI
jgi:hypothetical protein